ncbi:MULTISPECIES: GTPase Era [Thalassobaculum]|mgnify:CR=1 FL=1|uniref:GTPase Era n=1 Tax=Thalassobaculum litoreum DSM 18839 TaxID=1123362 RepID=A0A8G2BEA8_9PROT|nr:MULTISPECIES: GTPase Era [Thalassobaculum]SDF14838.1 GTP-binding protein Era [Thalassobaculum litoreum DSM 18839]
MNAPKSHCGFVALLGAPNAGKSTLVNQLVGAKVSIVTHKVQTTRTRIRGIALEGDAQIVLVDTPGIFKPKRRLDRAMVHAAWAGAGDADVVVLVADARQGLDDDTMRIIEGLKAAGRKAVLALNKVDDIKREKLLPIAAEFSEAFEFERVFMISALNGNGCADLRTYLAERMAPGPWLYPEDELSDLPMRLMAAEITREKVFLRLHDELPYSATVETDQWTERDDGSVRIDQTLYVERDSQKKIALGKGGQKIKEIGSLARTELEEMLERRVHLFLFVKVRENWQDDRQHLREWGLEWDV